MKTWQREIAFAAGLTLALVAAAERLRPAPSPFASGPPASPQVTTLAVPRTDASINVYADTVQPYLHRSTSGLPERVYVPNSEDGTVDVIDPAERTVVGHFAVGRVPHHITPAWDMRALYVDNTVSNTLTVIDPRMGQPVDTLQVRDPYNLYFTLDGTTAVVVAERDQRLDLYTLPGWTPAGSVPVPWKGVDHLDFSVNGRILLASAEYGGAVVKVDVAARAVTGSVEVGGLPVDVRLAPDGAVFYATNQGRHGVSVINPARMEEIQFIPTGRGAHGLQISRDARALYVSNRLAGTISVIDLTTRRIVTTWHVGGSPDMMQISPDGHELWVSNRFASSVAVINTTTGRVLDTIAVGSSPHGLTYFPQPGRFSLGHNEVYR
ncbi:MAG: cytochrome D1 domain-containing protein [Armatimonadota bacterium]|nr:cytochrome D1 domain-containing protein [Armatimonadota bacterium]MDR7404061.1 cytochrome D1 domain-containing protein [Armatimonadota bacterium]